MSHYFLCSQNKDSINNKITQLFISNFVTADFFLKTPSPNPARIPSQTLPCGRKISRGRANPNPRLIVSPCRVRILFEKGSSKAQQNSTIFPLPDFFVVVNVEE
jgi:hypothetical protein